MLKNVWNLQLFAEAPADTGASEGNADPNGTDVTTGDVAQTDKGVTSADAEQNKELENPETEVSFDELIEGKYKKDYNKAVNKIVRQRLKGTKQQLDEATNTLEAMQPMLNVLAGKYKVDANNIEAIVDSVERDNAMLEDEALERGMDVDTLRQIKAMEYENNRLKQEQQQSFEEQQRRENFDRIAHEAEELKTIYPNFDLEEEFDNPEFVKMLEFGFSVKNAFESLHLEELQNMTNEAIASEAAKRVVNSVKAGQKRPSENGVNSVAGSKVAKDIESLSQQEIDDYIARAKRGEKISFT